MKNLAIILSIASLGTTALHAQEPDLGTEAQREAGQVVYIDKCAHCHGETGDAVSPATAYLRPAPRDFTAGIYKFRSSASGELPTTEDIKRSIRDGMPYTSMPAWEGILSETDITNLAYFIKTFNDDFSGPYGVPELVEVPEAPAFSEASAERGRQVFEENKCMDCHGTYGRGNGDSAPTLSDQWDFHIRPADMTKRWTFRNGQTREDIYRTFTTGLDGSPMPSYDMPVEDRWALVDYVWSLSEAEPNYATAVFAQRVEGEVDISQGAALFENAEAALFPVVAQIIEPGRSFYPGVNEVEVKVVYNQEDIAFLLTWNDMSQEVTGSNGPGMAVPMFDPDNPVMEDTTVVYSDAIAIQVPTELSPGIEKPYIMYGDAKKAVDLWFLDLAKGTAEVFEGKGANAIQPKDGTLDVTANFDEGVWTVIMKRQRVMEEGLSFTENAFVPIAFSAWDGFYRERGNKRGMTSWYSVYIPPLETQSAVLPMIGYGLLTLILQLGLIFAVRRKYKAPIPA